MIPINIEPTYGYVLHMDVPSFSNYLSGLDLDLIINHDITQDELCVDGVCKQERIEVTDGNGNVQATYPQEGYPSPVYPHIDNTPSYLGSDGNWHETRVPKYAPVGPQEPNYGSLIYRGTPTTSSTKQSSSGAGAVKPSKNRVYSNGLLY